MFGVRCACIVYVVRCLMCVDCWVMFMVCWLLCGVYGFLFDVWRLCCCGCDCVAECLLCDVCRRLSRSVCVSGVVCCASVVGCWSLVVAC